MMGIIRIAAAAALIVGAGFVQGTWTNRFGPSAEMTALAARVDSIPMQIGDWKGTALELSARERKAAGAEACLSRAYTNASSGVSVSVLLVGGLPGDITTHTPDICYRGNGYVLDSPAPFSYRRGSDQRAAGFQTVLAKRDGANPSVLRIYWTWFTPQGWTAPDDVRWRYASEPTLCKLYIVRETLGAAVEPDPCIAFLEILLPELDRALSSAPG